MSNGRLVIDFNALQTAAGDIQNAVSSMRDQLSQCENDAKPLVETWEGGAQEAYFQRQAQWQKASNELAEMLQNIKTAVEQSADDFRSTEDANTRLFQ